MTLGMMATDVEQRIDFDAMRKYKLDRVQQQLVKYDLGSILCLDTDNIRYAASTYVGEWARDKWVRWCLIPREGEPVMFELGSPGQSKKELCPWIKPENIRNATPWARGAVVPEVAGFMTSMAAGNILQALKDNNVSDMPMGIDMMDWYILSALQGAGINVVNGWGAMWDARIIKSPDELKILETSASLVDGAWAHIADHIRPGIRESELVAEIYSWLLKQGCDRLSGVVCVSGPRGVPNPMDSSDRVIRPEELVYIDIMSHYLGYGSCYYRTFVTTRSNQKQRDVYKKANDWLQAGIDMVKPGITSADIVSAWPSAEELGFPNEIAALGAAIGHGVGLCIHEKPFISRAWSLDNPEPIEAGMHFAMETYANDGEDGARIESQIIVTEDGHKVITKWPSEELMVCDPR